MKPCTTEFLAWCSGFFDGEGSVAVSADRARTKHVLIVACSQVDRTPLDKIQSVFDGYIHRQKPTRSTFRRSEIFVWQATSLLAERFLAAIRPFSVVKAAEIDLAMRFRSETFGGKWRGRGKCLPQAILDKREFYRLALIEYRRKKYTTGELTEESA